MKKHFIGWVFLILGGVWAIALAASGVFYLFYSGREGATAFWIVLSFPVVALLAFAAPALFQGWVSAGGKVHLPITLWLLVLLFGLCSWSSGNTKGKLLFWYTLSFGTLAVLFDLVIRISSPRQTASGETQSDERYIPAHLRSAVLARDDYRCRYCGRRAQSLHVDHVMPVSQGGKSAFDNLVTACAQCNLKKAGRTPEQAGMQLLTPRATLVD